MSQVSNVDNDKIVKIFPKGEVHFFDPFKNSKDNFNVPISATSGDGKGLLMDSESFAIEKKFYEHVQLENVEARTKGDK